ncbi:MAG TPA: hypothetical protein VGR14_06075 [Verrucomicrobiae bacterium]|jgi:hypothetical protein|nr:hypothetical protein [Verrucomicrobiae bacterium]
MKKSAKTARGTKTKQAATGQIHPIIIYPFKQPNDYSDLEALYGLVARLASASENYARPLTIMDRKTFYTMEGNRTFVDFRNNTVARHSEIMDAWCVDTCQMWYEGLGAAFERGAENDVYWLIPGDFNYGSTAGQEVLGGLHDLPEIILELDQDVCVGEIATGHNNSKHLIDTYGTFALLYTWFPAEAQEIRQFTERPRSEFFALRHGFLREALMQRWYPYEQTVVMLLQAVFSKKRISRFLVGNISDLPEGREPLAPALQQVERTERVLKSVWRERNQFRGDWVEQYRQLEAKSEQVRRAAFTILQNHLT